MNTKALALMLLCSIVSEPLAASSHPAVQVPLSFTRNQVRIPVSVNGSAPFMLILDTGMPAPGILLKDSDRVAALGLEFPAVDSIHGGGTGPAVVTRVATANIAVGGVSHRDVTVSVMPASVLGDMDGVIGLELFGRYVVTVDFDRGLLTLTDPAGYTPPRDHDVVPMRLRDDSAFIDAKVSVDGGKPVVVDVAVDLGAGHALWLNEREPGRLAPPPGAIRSTLGRGVQGEIRGAIGRVARLELGRASFERVVALFPEPEFHNPGGFDFKDGFIGAEILKRFVVTFDYPSKRMVLVPGERFRDPFEWDMTGLVLSPTSSGQRHVDAVMPGSPAEAAGVRPGDVLVAVNDRPVAELSYDDLRRIFQRDGTELRLTLERDAARIDKALRLRRLI